MRIVNLTRNNSTVEQIEQGVLEPLNKHEVQRLIENANDSNLETIAAEIADAANCFRYALIESDTKLTLTLTNELLSRGIYVIFEPKIRRTK